MNSSISVEFDSPDDGAVVLGQEVERLWNGGRFDEALAQLDRLESCVGHVAIANTWRKPVATVEAGLWGRDVRIGNRDSLAELALDVQDSTGYLFAALRTGSGVPHISVCMSVDGGATWQETYTWSGSPPRAIDAAVLADHFFLAYNSPAENARQVRLRRFLCSNGRPDTFPGRGSWVAACTLDVGDTMKEVEIVPYQWAPTYLRQYLYTLSSDGSIRWSWSDGIGARWTTATAPIAAGASRGLDASANLEAESTCFFCSYYDIHDTLLIYGRALKRYSCFAGDGSHTSISAYRDRIVCAYEDGTTSPHRVRCLVNSGDGDTWTMSTPGDSGAAAYAPAVAARGGGFAVVFGEGAVSPALRFCRSAYDGHWSDPISISGNEPGSGRPAIVCLDSGVYGVAYLSDTSPVVRGAWFDRSDWVYGIAGEQQPQASSPPSMATVVHGVLFLPRDMTDAGHDANVRHLGSCPKSDLLDFSGRKVLDLVPGANDVRSLVSGVYFVRAEQARAGVETRAICKVLLVR